MHKDVARLVERFEQLGYRRERRKRHLTLVSPSGHERLTLNDGTHDDPERIKKLRGKLRHAEKLRAPAPRGTDALPDRR